MVEQGFHGAPMALIAQKAGVAAGTIYCHFSGREALINEIYRQIEGKVTAAVFDALDRSVAGRPVQKADSQGFSGRCTQYVTDVISPLAGEASAAGGVQFMRMDENEVHRPGILTTLHLLTGMAFSMFSTLSSAG